MNIDEKIIKIEDLKKKIHDFVGGKEIKFEEFLNLVFIKFLEIPNIPKDTKYINEEKQKEDLKNFYKKDITLPYYKGINMSLTNLFKDLYIDFGNLELINRSVTDHNRLQLHLAPSG